MTAFLITKDTLKINEILGNKLTSIAGTINEKILLTVESADRDSPKSTGQELFVESGVRRKECEKYCIPRSVVRVDENLDCKLPVVNLSAKDSPGKAGKDFRKGR